MRKAPSEKLGLFLILVLIMQYNPSRLDTTIVTAQTFSEANDHVSYWKNNTPLERLNAACAIINQIFGVTPKTKADRTILTARKHANS